MGWHLRWWGCQRESPPITARALLATPLRPPGSPGLMSGPPWGESLPPLLHPWAHTHWCSIWKLRCPLNQLIKSEGSTLQVAASCQEEVGHRRGRLAPPEPGSPVDAPFPPSRDLTPPPGGPTLGPPLPPTCELAQSRCFSWPISLGMWLICVIHTNQWLSRTLWEEARALPHVRLTPQSRPGPPLPHLYSGTQ